MLLEAFRLSDSGNQNSKVKTINKLYFENKYFDVGDVPLDVMMVIVEAATPGHRAGHGAAQRTGLKLAGSDFLRIVYLELTFIVPLATTEWGVGLCCSDFK